MILKSIPHKVLSNGAVLIMALLLLVAPMASPIVYAGECSAQTSSSC